MLPPRALREWDAAAAASAQKLRRHPAPARSSGFLIAHRQPRQAPFQASSPNHQNQANAASNANSGFIPSFNL